MYIPAKVMKKKTGSHHFGKQRAQYTGPASRREIQALCDSAFLPLSDPGGLFI